MEVGWAGWIRMTTGYKPYHYDMGEAEKPFRLDNTSISYIYKVLKHLTMQWVAIWVHPYFIKPMEVCQAGWTWAKTVYNPYHYDIVDAWNHFRLNLTSILYIYKVFKHLPMQWMAIWMQQPHGAESFGIHQRLESSMPRIFWAGAGHLWWPCPLLKNNIGCPTSSCRDK